LPPAEELIRDLAAVLGLSGADHGFDEASTLDGVVVVEHE
jgi:hypothetical protein